MSTPLAVAGAVVSACALVALAEALPRTWRKHARASAARARDAFFRGVAGDRGEFMRFARATFAGKCEAFSFESRALIQSLAASAGSAEEAPAEAETDASVLAFAFGKCDSWPSSGLCESLRVSSESEVDDGPRTSSGPAEETVRVRLNSSLFASAMRASDAGKHATLAESAYAHVLSAIMRAVQSLSDDMPWWAPRREWMAEVVRVSPLVDFAVRTILWNVAFEAVDRDRTLLPLVFPEGSPCRNLRDRLWIGPSFMFVQERMVYEAMRAKGGPALLVASHRVLDAAGFLDTLAYKKWKKWKREFVVSLNSLGSVGVRDGLRIREHLHLLTTSGRIAFKFGEMNKKISLGDAVAHFNSATELSARRGWESA